ncbi:hypothetical protein FS837_008840 [Tulasnella sp. UAMH 9824]|nr:hypothetical protein FS837_008840 [Tulasnella sp. UAMH 9824]
MIVILKPGRTNQRLGQANTQLALVEKTPCGPTVPHTSLKMPQPISSPPLAIVPPPLPRQLRRIPGPQRRNLHRLEESATLGYLNLLCVLGALTVLYVSWVLSPALGSEDQCPPVNHPSIWVPIAFIVSFATITVHLYYFVAKLFDRSQRPELELPSIRIHDLDEAVHAPETPATSPQSLAPDEAVPGTLRPPDRHLLRLQGPHSSQPPQPTNAEYPTNGRSRHVVNPVERIPLHRTWLQDATGQGLVIDASQNATWNTPAESALLGWTFFFPSDPRMFGRVRKQPQHRGPIFSSPNCDVWKCEIEFSEPSSLHPDKAALKVVRRYVQNEQDPIRVLERINARLYQEAVTWAAVHHPNTVPLLGVIFSPIHALVLPWYRYGNLRAYLAQYPAATKLKLVDDIAKALEHLHLRTPKIVQADIKPENILINDQGDALITDFGMATVLGEDHWYTPSHLHGGTMQWMAPEILLGQSDKRSRTGDVYSFGSLTCYIMIGRVPHASRSIGQVISALNDTSGSSEPIDKWNMHPEFQDYFGGLVAGIIPV